MELDIDYLDLHRDAKRARWRMKLTALALVACVLMLGDLVAQAKPLNDIPVPEPARVYEIPHQVPAPFDAQRVIAGGSKTLIFNLPDGALSSPEGKSVSC